MTKYYAITGYTLDQGVQILYRTCKDQKHYTAKKIDQSKETKLHYFVNQAIKKGAKIIIIRLIDDKYG